MVVTARRIELVSAVRIIADRERIKERIEMLNEDNYCDRAADEGLDRMEMLKEPPVECLECPHLTEAYNEPISPEMAGEYLGLQCLKGGCDRG